MWVGYCLFYVTDVIASIYVLSWPLHIGHMTFDKQKYNLSFLPREVFVKEDCIKLLLNLIFIKSDIYQIALGVVRLL